MNTNTESRPGMEKGYIKLWRKFRSHPFWREERRFSRAEAFLDLAMSANGKDRAVIFRGQSLMIRRGQFLTSIRKLSERWGWSRTKASDFLNYLQNSDNSIRLILDHRKALVTVTNYAIYNPLPQSEKATEINEKSATEKPLKGHKKDITNKDLRINKEKSLSDEFFTLVNLLSEKMKQNDPGAKIPRTEAQRKKWATDFRLLIERDGRPIEEVQKVLVWCQIDPFWRGNVLSASKFREKYPQLKLRMEEQEKKSGTKRMTREEFNRMQEEALKRR